jgi:hypothetical protein
MVIAATASAKTPKKLESICKEKHQISQDFKKFKLVICEDHGILISKGKKVDSIPVIVEWEDSAEKTKNNVTLTKVSTPILESQSFVLSSTANYGDGTSCGQFLTAHNNELLIGPEYCIAGEGFVKEFKVRKNRNQIEVAVVVTDEDLSGPEIKTTTYESQVWTWKNNKWEKTFEKESEH